MANFQWEGKTRDGTLRTGVLVAANSEAALAQLKNQNIMVTSVKAQAKDLKELLPFLKKGVSTCDLVVFTRQFATMIDAGLPLVQCLDILSNQQPNKTFKETLIACKADVENGSTFADALGK